MVRFNTLHRKQLLCFLDVPRGSGQSHVSGARAQRLMIAYRKRTMGYGFCWEAIKRRIRSKRSSLQLEKSCLFPHRAKRSVPLYTRKKQLDTPLVSLQKDADKLVNVRHINKKENAGSKEAKQR